MYYQTSPWDALSNRRRGVGLLSRMADPVRPFPQTDMTGQPIPAQTPLVRLPVAERPVTLDAGQITPTLPTRPFANVQRTVGADGAVSFPQRPGPGAPMQQGAPLQMLAPSTHQSTLWDQLGEIDPATWFQMAGAFLNAEGDPGAAFSGVGQALAGAGDRRFQEEQRGWMRDEAKRAGTAFDQQQADRKRVLESYTRLINDPNTPQSVRDALVAGGPEAMADIMSAQMITPVQERQLGLQERGIELQLRQMEQSIQEHKDNLNLGYARLNQDRYMNSLTAGLGRDEAAYIAGMRQRLDNGNSILPDLNELQEIAERNPRIFGALLEPDMESAIRKLGRGNQADITDIQRVYSIAAGLARDELRGQTPVSNLDLRVAIQTGPSTQSTQQAVTRWIQAARNDYSRMERQFQSALAYGQRMGGLSVADPASGRNWYQDNYQAYNGAPQGGGANRASVEEIDAEIARRRGGSRGGGNAPARREPVTRATLPAAAARGDWSALFDYIRANNSSLDYITSTYLTPNQADAFREYYRDRVRREANR